MVLEQFLRTVRLKFPSWKPLSWEGVVLTHNLLAFLPAHFQKGGLNFFCSDSTLIVEEILQ